MTRDRSRAPVSGAQARQGSPRLLAGASIGALVLALAATPAHAQLAQMRAAAGTLTTPVPGTIAMPVPVRPANMREALQRSQALQSRADQLRSYVTSARNAAVASTRITPTDGISANGLDPIAVIRSQVVYVAAGADPTKATPNAAPSSVSAASDTTGTNTWQGASAPVQSVSNGQTTVTINQTDARALLSWNSFNVGANTTLNFNQKSGGVAQPSWTVVNRVVNSVAPSQILGKVTADGTVLVLNRSGVIFGKGAQVNLHSLVASSLELGNFASGVIASGQRQLFVAATIKDRNTAYLQNGLLTTPVAGYKGQFLSALLPNGTYDVNSALPIPRTVEGDVMVESGATITTGDGGYLILAGPSVTNAGTLSATNGQVSLQGGRYIGATASTGADGSVDPNVRGLILSSQVRTAPSAPPPPGPDPDQGVVVNFGLIESRRGYLSLGTSVFGNVTNSGLLSDTTSVSRNGKISLTGGTVTLTGSTNPNHASGIEILPDDDGETIPQGTAAAPPSFKTSQITIGDSVTGYLSADSSGDIALFPSVFTMGQNAFILAPSADVTIGQNASAGAANVVTAVARSIDIASGAVIDVSGVKDVQLGASRNSLEISPVKRNELRDTPNYREVTTDGSFTLNGATLYVDPRVSGVRSDGVAWVGSPLIEAGSAASQIPVTAAELMTKGGNISLNLGPATGSINLDPAAVPGITIAKDVVFDMSGGWVTYAAGNVLTSQLVTSDGRIVDISEADPNDSFVAVANGFTAVQPKFGITQTFQNALVQGNHYEAAYDEGRDAGSLIIAASKISFDGTVHGDAFAGANQIAEARQPTAASTIVADPRKLQSTTQELPSGGFFRIGSFTGSSTAGLGGDIIVYHGDRGTAAADPSEILLDDTMLSNAGLSALTLQTSGGVTFASTTDTTRQSAAALTLTGNSNLTLADGGVLTVDAGRSILFDGNVAIADGTIAARTYQLTNVGTAGIGTVGSPFRTDDDIASLYAGSAALPRPFDITVNGTLSTAGRWVNDYLDSAHPSGSAWTDGGTISLTVAPKAFVPIGASAATAPYAGDLSGSIAINAGALLDVSAGGYVGIDRSLKLDASGGNVSLIDETTYATVVPTIVDAADPGGTLVNGQTVAFTPTQSSDTFAGVTPTLTPRTQRASVRFAAGSIKGFGFSGGGTFKLVSPDVSFGTGGDALATKLPLDFLSRTGFGTLDVTSYHARTIQGLFDNGSIHSSAFFDTTRLVVGAGQTLDLTQTVLPSMLDAATAARIANLATGSNITSQLAPSVPTALWDRKAANLTLRGLTELDVEAGGQIVGAPLAKIIAPKIHNAGTIVLPGGTISQVATLPSVLNATGFGVSDPAFGGTGLAAVFGAQDANGHYVEDAQNTAGFTNVVDGTTLTNGEIFTTPGREHFLYFLGEVGADQGIVLDSGSVTNLAGIALYNPHAPFQADGTQYRIGKIIDGGSIGTAAPLNPVSDLTQALFPNPAYGFPAYPDPNSGSPTPPPQLAQTAARTLIASAGSKIDISGTSATFDEPDSATTYAPTLEWSDAGTLSLLAGGSIAGARINAQGGDAAATGGTLQWFDPDVRGTGAHSGVNFVSAAQIMNAGFDTLVAYGGLTLDGSFDLKLGKALLVESAASLDGTTIGSNPGATISATAGTDATISAPYIHFSSRSGTTTASASPTSDGVVTFEAGAAGIDFSGGILFDASIATTNLDTAGDVRLIGVDDRTDPSQLPVLNGSLVSAGNLAFDAARVYTTTGTGNLQRILEDEAGATDSQKPSPYLLTAQGTSTITFAGDHINSTTPLSAGSYLRIQAFRVVQNGYLAAPLGRIEFGTANDPIHAVRLGSKSITSVSGAGQDIPYGTTTDLTEYYFTPGSSAPITRLPSGDLRISGFNITVDAGGTVDGRGGGDVFAYEFVSGTGGSRDILSRFNSDTFSSNDYSAATGTGYQYPDQRQVYAIVPADQASKIAKIDPVYSADYGAGSPTDLYGAQAGLSVTLDGSGGIPAGQYLLLPAHYALLPGAYRVVENVGATAPAPGSSQTQLDGSIVVGGTYSTAGTKLAQSQRRSFTLESQSTLLKFSDIQTTSGTTTIQNQAASAGVTVSRIPLDAARVILDPLISLKVSGTFETTPGTGGRGSQVDILGNNILITHNGMSAGVGAARQLVLNDSTLANLNASSLVIGGERTDNADDTTTLGVTASHIEVAGDTTLSVPELVLAVAGQGSTLTIDGGAKLTATGTVADSRAGDYVITSTDSPAFDDPFNESGVGSVLRLANGPQRLIDRQGSFAERNSRQPSTLRIFAATLSGDTLSLDTSRRFFISPTAKFKTPSLALSADLIQFGGQNGISPTLEAQFAAAKSLTLRSPDAISFDPGTHQFNDLTIDGPGIALGSRTGVQDAVRIEAGAVRLSNLRSDGGACSTGGATMCATTGNTLTIAANSLTFGSGTVRTYGFDGRVTLSATQGAYVTGKGGLDVGGAALTLRTPFLVDRAAVIDPNSASPIASDQITPSGNYTIPVTPNYLFATSNAVTLTAPTLASGAAAPTPAGLRAPGSHIAFGTADAPVANVRIDGVDVSATAGVIDIESRGNITLANAATLATPGYTRTFGDSQSSTTVSAGGGTVNLVSLRGDIVLPDTAKIIVDSGIGNAGTLNAIAADGAITFAAMLDPGVTGARDASLTFDSQDSAFDLDGFATRYGVLFGGDIAIRSGAGDLALGAGHTLTATSIGLTADGGAIDIAGTIDTSGVDVSKMTASAASQARVDGGDIALYGMNGVTLASGSLLDTHTSGYLDTDTRQASAGDVTIGIGDTGGAIAIASGAKIDVGARRTQTALVAGDNGNRLVPTTIKDPDTLVDTTVYHFVSADQGGVVSLRAPVLGAADDKVDIRLGGAIVGAGSTEVEGYKSYDLDAIASSGLYSGVTASGSTVTLSLADSAATTGKGNILSEDFVGADGTASVVHFVRNFDVSTVDGSSLAGFRLRPGVDLESSGNLTLATNWNLAAGTLDQPAALAAGLLTAIPELGKRADGSAYYAVVPGQEGNLLANYVDFLYRVGGRASGEAGVFTLHAARDLTIAHSISDGFFTFGDKSDPAYINYQLGGGDRTYNPALPLTCGSAQDCGGIASYTDVASGAVAADSDNTVTIALNRVTRGTEVDNRFVNSPYDAAANSAAALGSGTDGAGDPLGFATLFPLLPDGSPIRSSDLRLVGGAGATISANPLHVDRASGGDVTVTGETSYSFTSTAGAASLGDSIELALRVPVDPGSPAPIYSLTNLLSTTDQTGGAADLTGDSYTTISWGSAQTGAAADERRFAGTFFANRPATFLTTGTTTSGVAAPLSEVLLFLRRYQARFIDGVEAQAPGYPSSTIASPAPISFGTQQAYARTMVRTGDGMIAVVAGGNVDLRGGATAVYRTEKDVTSATQSQSNAQVGGSAIYTAGHRVSPASVTARVIGGGATVSVTPDSPYLAIAPEQVNFIPSPKGFSDQAATFATDGGAVLIDAGGDVLGRRDVYSERFLGSGASYTGNNLTTFDATQIGDASQRWRPGVVGQDTEIAIAPKYFTSGVGALAGGDITLKAGGDVSDLTVALDAAVTTATTSAGRVQMTFGQGDLDARIGGNLLAGQIDLANGAGRIAVGGDVAGFGKELNASALDTTQYLRLRIADATLALSAQGSVALAGVSALGAAPSGSSADEYNAAGFFSADAGLGVVATGTVSLVGNRPDQTQPFQIGEGGAGIFGGIVLPPSLSLAALSGDIKAPSTLPMLLYPSPNGQLTLLSAGSIDSLVLAMSDSDPSLLPGAFSAAQISLDSVTSSGAGDVVARVGLGFGIPGVDATTSDRLLRLYHNQNPTHAGDTTPVQIYAGVDITNSLINLPKLARIGAGRDILNLYFTGQNLATTDTTRITAGRDILGTTAASQTANLPYIVSSNYTLGGPGAFSLEAGRNLGPFINSATVGTVSYAGGVRTVGNDANPWLASQGADLTVLFGTGRGVDYTALREAYLNPDNLVNLDGDLFVQTTDTFGNSRPDRTEYTYAPILATWLRNNDPVAFDRIFGAAAYPDTTAGNAALATAAYGKMSDLYTAFTALDPLLQDKFLINDLYFNELKQPAEPTSPSYLQYVRGYRAVNALFPTSLGYTDNLAPYTTDPSTVNADHPLGVPKRNIVDGQPQQATRVQTGNVDLRLATIETTRGGNITILGPGGNFIAGSVVRTSEQAARRVTRFGVDPASSLAYGQLNNPNVQTIDAIPIGFEGVLTLRGGAVESFTDGDFRVNQSRVFTQAGGDITLWSSNGDLNAGQGPRSASNFPPISVRFDLDGFAEVDTAGSVSGAGIGAFKRNPTDPDSTVILVAPVGLVDAGDAGVRATGDIFVAAARVANADAFSAGGSISGVPSLAAAPTSVAPTAAASSLVSQLANVSETAGNAARRSLISVDVLGYSGTQDPCADPDKAKDADCQNKNQ